MKKIVIRKILIICSVLEVLIFMFYSVFYSVNADNKEDIINSQKQNLRIADFTNEAQKYTRESLPGVDLNDLLSTAIFGKIDNINLMTLFWKLLR